MKRLVLIGLLSLSMTFKVFAMVKGGSAPSSPSSLEKDLMAAAVAGNAELVNALIQKGANIDVQSKAGTTPLLAAVSQGHLEVVKTLLESDAKSDIRDNSGKTAFAIASQKYEDKKLDLHAQKKYESIKELLIKSERNGLLLEGIKANTEECNSCVEKILDLGADINVIDKQNHGHTALMIAILYRNRDMAKLLINRGADVNIQSFDEETALMRATDQKDTELVELLIGAKANVNDQDKSKQTALMLAIDKGNFPIAKSLMDARANVNAKTNFEQTPLMLAAKIINPKSAVEITRKLIENKADIDAVDFNGVSALMHLASRGNYKTLALLLDAGAKTDTQDKKGVSALFVAAKYGRTEAVKTLLKAQADYLAFDHSNLGLLAYAELSKNPKVIDIIGCLPVDIICDRSKGPCFKSLKDVEERLLNPSKIWLKHAEGRKLTLATMVASHDIWCKGNPSRSNIWATLLHRVSVRKGFSLELSDLGVTASSKLSESEVVSSSNAKPKICYPK